MNKYIIIVTIITTITMPLGVYIGYQMALENWSIVVLGILFLMVEHIFTDLMWVRGQSIDAKEQIESKKELKNREF